MEAPQQIKPTKNLKTAVLDQTVPQKEALKKKIVLKNMFSKKDNPEEECS